MPAGEITWSTLATSSAGGTSELRFFEASPEGTGKLVSGKNVIAVEKGEVILRTQLLQKLVI